MPCILLQREAEQAASPALSTPYGTTMKLVGGSAKASGASLRSLSVAKNTAEASLKIERSRSSQYSVFLAALKRPCPKSAQGSSIPWGKQTYGIFARLH